MESSLLAGAGAPDLKLIETLAWDGARLVRLDLHLERLMRSAHALGWWCDPSKVTTALQAAITTQPARMRLTLDATGHIEVQTSALPAAKPVWRICIARQRLRSDDPWLGIKSSNRGAYDAARAELAEGLDEAILLNERDEVCDGSITTVFFDCGEGLRTPPLASGLLPGVLRAQMAVPEALLLAKDLPRVRLWVGNSLRGLMAADLVD